MSKQKFLNTLQYFDENYNTISIKDDKFSKTIDDKRLFRDDKHSQSYNHIDIKEVRQITQTNDNCFVRFYNLKEDWLFAFFKQLSNIELGLLYINDFAEHHRDNQTLNRNNALQKKIDSVLEYAEAVGTREQTIKDIEYLRNSLDNKHLTKHRLFENLLFWVALLLNNARNSYIVANTTNAIIKDYFRIEDIEFSRYAKIENYIETTYKYYDAKGITIHHS